MDKGLAGIWNQGKRIVGIVGFGLGFVLVGVFLGGCWIFNVFQGSFGAKDWEIQKIVVEDKTYLGLEDLRVYAKDRLQNIQQNQEELFQEEGSQEKDSSKDSSEESLKELKEELEELAASEGRSTWSFDAKQKKIYGVAACNQFSANYTWKDADRISIYDVIFTRKLCSPSQSMTFELNLSRNMKGIFFVQKNGDEMVLKGENTQIYLRKNENNPAQE